MYPGVELRVMRYFLAVQAELHFSRAAERVHVAQPSLSKQIRNLEEELGVTLFKRSRHGVELTESGEAFADSARQSLLYAERAAAQARAAGAGTHGKLLIGISPAVDTSLLFRVRAAFNRQYPDLTVEAICATAVNQAEQLTRSGLHVGLIELPIRYRGLDIVNIARERLVFAVPQSCGLTTSRVVPQKIESFPLIVVCREADLSHDRIVTSLKGWGYQPRTIRSVSTSTQALDFVAAGEGIAAVRENLCRFRTKGIAYCPAEDLPVLDTAIAYRRDIQTPVVRNFLRVVRQEFARERQAMKTGARAKR